jgi:SAM-dependent methyltransferase
MNLRLLPLLRDPNDQAPLELFAFAFEPGFSTSPPAPSASPSTSPSTSPPAGSSTGSAGATPASELPASSRVREGVLVQPQSGRWYPIEDGLPSLFVDALRVGDQHEREQAWAKRHAERMKDLPLRLQNVAEGEASTSPADAGDDFARMDSERRARDEQAEEYDRMLAMRALEFFEHPAYRAAIEEALATAVVPARATKEASPGLPGLGSGLPLFEAGCGTGRLTGIFADLCDEVVALDLSRDSIERNRVRHAGRTRATVHYVHGDLTHLPLRDACFGATAHCGVYEHIPSRELRVQFLAHARRTLVPGGTLLLSAYRYAGITRLFEKQGEHRGGIPFFRFSPDELREEVETAFSITSFRENLGIYMSMVTARPLA